MMKRPINNSREVFSFLYPLSNKVWVSLAFACIGVSLALYFISCGCLSKQNIVNSDEDPAQMDKFSILNSLWFTYAALMQQGCDFEPRLVD